MTEMFEGCLSLNSIDLSNFETPSLTELDKMFFDCINLTYLNIQNFYIDYPSIINIISNVKEKEKGSIIIKEEFYKKINSDDIKDWKNITLIK